MQRSGPLSRGGGTRHCAHHGWPHSSHCATACSVQCFVQFANPSLFSCLYDSAPATPVIVASPHATGP
jgi:hypothetical protein